jgi:putative oxidoreductase
MNTVQKFGPLAGRILLGLIFVLSGFGKLTGFGGTVGYIASKGLPLPQILAGIALVVELGGGLLLILGWKARWAAAALAIFTVLAALLFHNFWTMPPEQVQNQTIHFLKNLSIVGGLLYVVTYGSGPLAVDRSDA